MQRKKSLTSLSALCLIAGSQAIKSNQLAQLDASDNCQGVTAEQQEQLRNSADSTMNSMVSTMTSMQNDISSSIESTRTRINGEIADLKSRIKGHYNQTSQYIEDSMKTLEYELDNVQTQTIQDLKTAGCLGATCQLEPEQPTETEIPSDETEQPVEEKLPSEEQEPVSPSDETEQPVEEEETEQVAPSDQTEQNVQPQAPVEPEVQEISIGAHAPVVFIVDNIETPDEYYLDPAGAQDYVVKVVIGEDPSHPVEVKLNDEKIRVIYIDDPAKIPSIICIEGQEGKDCYLIEDQGTEDQKVTHLPEDKTELVPSDEPYPAEEDISSGWKPSYSPEGAFENVIDTNTDQPLPSQPSTVEIIPPAEGLQQFQPTPSSIEIIDSGANKPIAYLIDESVLVIDYPSDQIPEDHSVVIIEHSDEPIVVKVDDQKVPVIQIDRQSEIIQIAGGQTKVIDQSNPSNPVISNIEVVQQEPEVMDNLPQPSPEDEAQEPSSPDTDLDEKIDEHNEVEPDVVTEPEGTQPPAENQIQDSWKPVFDSEGNLSSIEDSQGSNIEPTKVVPTTIPIKDNEQQPSILTPTEIAIHNGGSEKPEAYIIDTPSGSSIVVDPASGNTAPQVIVIEEPGSTPTIIVDGKEADVIEIGSSDQDLEIVHTIEGITKIVDNTNPETPVISHIEDQVAPAEEKYPESHPVVLPSDSGVPVEEDISNSWTPQFDQEGNVVDILDREGNSLSPTTITPTVVPVKENEHAPAIVTPDTIYVYDGGADKPEAYIIEQGEGKQPYIVVDSASDEPANQIILIEEPGSKPTVIVDGQECLVIPTGSSENPTSVIHTRDGQTSLVDDSGVHKVIEEVKSIEEIVQEEVKEESQQQEETEQTEQEQVPADKPIVQPVLVPTEESPPQIEDQSDAFKPVFDETGIVIGFVDGNEDQKIPSQTIQPIIHPVHELEENPSVESPSEVIVIPGSTKVPQAFIIDQGEGQTPVVVIDPGYDQPVEKIIIEERPNDIPHVIVDGEKANVIPIGGYTESPEVIHTNDGQTVVVQSTDPQNPQVYVVEEHAQLPNDTQTEDNLVEDPSGTIPSDIENKWSPSFDQNGVFEGVVDSEGKLITPDNVTPTVVPVNEHDAQPSIDSPSEVKIVNGGAKEPECYIIETSEGPIFIIDQDSETTLPTIEIIEQANHKPKVYVNDTEVSVIELPSGAEIEVAHTPKGETKVIDLTDPEQPTVYDPTEVPVEHNEVVRPQESQPQNIQLIVVTDDVVPTEGVSTWSPSFNNEGECSGTQIGNELLPLVPVAPNQVDVYPVTEEMNAPKVVTPVEIYTIDGGAKSPQVVVVDNGETKEPTFIIDPANILETDELVKIEIIENPDQMPFIKVNGQEAAVIAVGGQTDSPSIVNTESNDVYIVSGEQVSKVFDVPLSDANIQTEMIETEKPQADSIDSKWQASFDETGKISEILDQNGLVMDIESITPQIIPSADPSPQKAPESILIVDGGAPTPQIYVVETPEGSQYIADIADGKFIAVVEQPSGNQPVFIVDGQECVTIPVGTADDANSVIHINNGSTIIDGNQGTKLVDYSTQEQRNQQEAQEEAEKEPSPEVNVEPTSQEGAPKRDDVESGWVISHTSQDAITVIDYNSNEIVSQLEPVPITIKNVSADQVDIQVPASVYMVPGYTDKPIIYNYDSNYICDCADKNAEDYIVVVEQEDGPPKIYIDAIEIPIVDINPDSKEPGVIHTKDDQTFIVNNEDIFNPTYSKVIVDYPSSFDYQGIPDGYMCFDLDGLANGCDIILPVDTDRVDVTLIQPGVDAQGQVCVDRNHEGCFAPTEPSENTVVVVEESEQPPATEDVCEEKLVKAEGIIAEQAKIIEDLEAEVSRLESECVSQQ